LSSAGQVLQRRAVFSLLAVLRVARLAAMRRESTHRLLFTPRFEGTRWQLGRWRAWLASERARKEVPAYQDFLRAHGDPRPRVRRFQPDLALLPETDKESYVNRYSIEDRCRGGRIPSTGVVVDESSGTSGAPNNWVRGIDERREVKQALQIAFHHQLGREPVFVLNAFALGPWATGMNVSMSLVDVAILKSIGPDVAKIEATLKTFGPRYRYVIAGYPPFLKTVVDTADIDWSAHRVTAFYGGEGMTEGMRDYLRRFFDGGVYGSYGASDLEINIGAESDFTIALRRLLRDHPDVCAQLGAPPDADLPMVFQYNPLDYHLESSAEGELVVTLCRTTNAAPKIRYNIHDLGHPVRMPTLQRTLREAGIEPPPSASDLPLLFLYGRADQAVPYFGSKVTPTNVEEVLFALPDLAECVGSFALVASEDEQATKHLAIAFELVDGARQPADLAAVRERVLAELRRVNQDFREASRFIPPESVPTVELHEAGTGPFAGHDVRLKRRYVRRSGVD
jgi:phenylacetate-coenzyme A ligase PaaK-like adenylate-forming protein